MFRGGNMTVYEFMFTSALAAMTFGAFLAALEATFNPYRPER
jgi:hypothetical protein